MNVSVVSGLCCRETFPKLLTCQSQNGGFSAILRTDLLQINSTGGKVHPEVVSSGSHNSPDIKNPKWEPQTQAKFRVPQIYFIHPVRRRKSG